MEIVCTTNTACRVPSMVVFDGVWLEQQGVACPRAQIKSFVCCFLFYGVGGGGGSLLNEKRSKTVLALTRQTSDRATVSSNPPNVARDRPERYIHTTPKRLCLVVTAASEVRYRPSRRVLVNMYKFLVLWAFVCFSDIPHVLYFLDVYHGVLEQNQDGFRSVQDEQQLQTDFRLSQ